MEKELAALKRAIQRERQARKNSEALLEEKSLELYHANLRLTNQNNVLEEEVSRRTKQLVEEKERAEEASKAKAQFLSVMSHEIRTPLNAVIGMSHLLLDNEPREDQLDLMESLEFSAKHLHNLINDILDFSKIEAQKLEIEEINTDLGYICRQLSKTLKFRAEQKNILFKLDDPEVIPTVLTDPTRIAQVITNLAGNAIKFTEKGEVGIRMKSLEKKAKEILVQITIYDTGIGIPENKIDTIFESFSQADLNTTRKFGGTGLGLTITKNIVQKMGGHIKVTSQLGKGSQFNVIIPFKISQDHTSSNAYAENKIPTGKTILLAEDNAMNVKVANGFLKKLGINMVHAENGKKAYMMIVEQGINADLILMDLEMPEWDGYQATEQIRHHFPELPIIALTANATVEIKKRALSVGMNDYLTKPFDPGTFTATLKRHLAPKVLQ